jgi:TRAP-type uncharacterized transport system fused permease subunit
MPALIDFFGFVSCLHAAASKATVTPLPTTSRVSTQPLFKAHAKSAKETKPTGMRRH